MKNLLLAIQFSVAALCSYAQYDPHALFAPQKKTMQSAYRLPSGIPAPNYWQNKADYSIRASFNPATAEISGAETITYKNNSPSQLNFLWLQLDQNLFNKDSRGQQRFEAGRRSRYGKSNSNFEGGFRIKSVKINNKPANFSITDTRMQIWLSDALQAGGATLSISIEYAFYLPEEGSDRCGILNTEDGKIFAVAQWYPRLCVYDDLQGWNTDPYLGPGEFYLEYGDFDVEITAPSSLLVVAGADQTNREQTFTADELNKIKQAEKSDKTIMIRDANQMRAHKSDKGQKTWKFKLKNSRDFSWAASGAFLLDGCSVNLPSGKKVLAMSVYPKNTGGKQAWGRSSEYIKASLENYSRRWFEYPYPVAVNVATNINGMEYPGIVFCNAKSEGSSLFGVTDHEFGHTWFPMIVGSNERKYAWMDEGFNEFINFISAEDVNGGEFKNTAPTYPFLNQISFADGVESVWNAPHSMKEVNIGADVYFKPAYALTLLRNVIIGQERFDRAFRYYIANWAYKHPAPEDFFNCIENATGEDLHWFWESWFIENYKLDQSVESVSFNGEKTGNTVVLKNRDQMAMPVIMSYVFESGKTGSLTLPAEVWSNTAEFHAFIPSTEPIVKLTIDPQHYFPDLNLANNNWGK